MTRPLRVSSHPGVSALAAADWDRLVGDEPPFLEHAFLTSLEEAGCVGPDTGWHPQPITVHDEMTGELLGAAPAYLKTHSMGEFVYDWAWADAAERAGVQYYPKLVLAVPFTPVAGRRLLVEPALDPDEAMSVRRALLAGAVQLAADARCGGVHMLFCQEDERDAATAIGFVHRLGQQFHWVNDGYGEFADFLARFRSKRRNQIRRERRRVAEQGFETVSLLGDEVLDEHRELAFRFYCATVDQFRWGRRYLNERFFESLWARQRDRLQLTLARNIDDGRVLAGTVNMQKGDARWGRYWGCDANHPFLHFEVCSYAPIEDCIGQGVQRFEAGAGGGSHKYGRGFLPAFTHSAHLLFNDGFHQAVADFCRREALIITQEAGSLTASLFAR